MLRDRRGGEGAVVVDQPAEEHPAAPGTSDRGLIIMLIVGGLIIMFFVLLAGVVGMTP